MEDMKIVENNTSPHNLSISSLDYDRTKTDGKLEHTSELHCVEETSKVPTLPVIETGKDHHANILEDSKIETLQNISDEQKPLEASRSLPEITDSNKENHIVQPDKNILEDSKIETLQDISNEQKPVEASEASYKVADSKNENHVDEQKPLEASALLPATIENHIVQPLENVIEASKGEGSKEEQNLLVASGTNSRNDHGVVQSKELNLPEVKVVNLAAKKLESTSKTVYSSPKRVVRPAKSFGSPQSGKQIDMSKIEVDTSAPFESVKVAVSKFGGIVDWKAHKIHTVERQKLIEEELEKAHEEIPEYKKMSEVAEESKLQVLKELESTKRHIEELKLSLERAQTEEQQAKQDAELAKLRVQEMEQGIADEASVATKAQLEVAKARHAAAVIELKSLNEELEALRKDHACLVNERDLAVKKASDALVKSREVEKKVEELTIELISVKEALETAHAAHLEAEEKRIGAAMASEQDFLTWDKELKQAEDEVTKLEQQVISTEDLKSKLETASSLLLDLKAELAVYMESELSQENGLDNKTHIHMQAAIESAKADLEQIKINIEKGRDEVVILNVAATSLKSDLEKEKMELSRIKQREGMASVAVASLQAEIDKTNAEIAVILMKEKEEREKMAELPKKLHLAAQDADQAKSMAEIAREELRKAEEEAEQAKAYASTIESRLLAAQKEIDAAKASEKLAVAAIKALHESETSQKINDGESPTGVTISLEEYYELSKKAHEAEERAAADVAAAVSLIDAAKEFEMRSLEKLKEINQELSSKKEVMRIALENAENAKEGKLGIEQELRKWRAEHEQQRKISVSSIPNDIPIITPTESKKSFNYESSNDAESSPDIDLKVVKKKKRSLFPRALLFLVKKRPNSSKTSS